MRRPLKYLFIGVAAVLAVLLGGLAIFAASFNPNDYKPQLISLVKEKKQRTLEIPGEVKLSFFPKLGVDLGQVRISEHGSNAPFASVDRARLSLALLPLLSKNLIVDRVDVEGLNASLRREKDGSTNFDDLLSKDEKSSNSQLKFDIDSVQVKNAHLAWDDRQAQRKLDVSGLNLETGRLADGVPSKANLQARIKGSNPAIDATLQAKTGFLFELEKKRYAVNGLDGELKGALLNFTDLHGKLSGDADLQPASKRFDFSGFKLAVTGKQSGQPIELKLDIPKLAVGDNKVSGGKLSGEARLAPAGRNIALNFQLPSFEGTPQAFKLPALVLDANLKDAKTDAKAHLEGSVNGDLDKMAFNAPRLQVKLSGKQGETAIDGAITASVNARLGEGLIDLSGINANASLPNPGGGSMKLVATGAAQADMNKQAASAKLQGKLDESSFDAKLGLAHFSPAAYTFDVNIDKLDADRYRARPAQGASAPAGEEDKAKPEQPIDLSALRTLRASGSLKVGSLKAQNLRLSNVRLDLKAADGKLDINPLNASLYGGSLAGSASVLAAQKPRFALRQNLTNVNIGPLLKDAINKDPVEGRGNVNLDVTTEGDLVAELKKSLAGTAKLELRDGAVKGFNIGQVIRNAKARIGQLQGNAPPQTGTGSAAEKTDFSELTGSFKINKGVAHNDDLRAKSPLLRVDGSGDVNIGEDRLDYLVKATVVSTLQGQGGPEMQALKGLTVPVRLSGPFNAIGYKVDFSGVASGLVKQQLESHKDELKGKVEQELGKQLKGLFGR